MINGRYGEPKINCCFNSIKVFGICFLVILLCFSSSVMAGDPAGGKDGIYIYNVSDTSFSVVWQVDKPSTCTVTVYTDNADPPTEATFTPTPWANSNDPNIAQARGVMQVDVSGLSPETPYWVQTSSTEIDTSATFNFPNYGDLIPVTTGPTLLTPPSNGKIELALVDPNDNYLTDGVVAIAQVPGANYPISSANNGWPISRFNGLWHSVVIDLTKLVQGDDWWNLVTEGGDHNITVLAFGGLIGMRKIDTTHPESLIGENQGCFGTDFDGCVPSEAANIANKVTLYTNRPPEMVITPPIPVEANYEANTSETFTFQICAYDPDEGDTVTDIYLGGDVPSGMTPDFPLADANCANINWATPSVGGFFENIQIFATDGVNPSTVTFGVTVLNGPPTEPDVSISATTTPVTTDADLICEVDANSIRNPDPGDQIFIDYEWYEDGVLIVSNMDKTEYTDTLSNSETGKDKKYYCKVTVSDKDGDADPVNTSEVEIQNTAPNAPANAVVTPSEPETNQDLICTVTPATVTDLDPEDAGSIEYGYRWTCTSCDAPDVVEHGPKLDSTDSLSNSVTDKNEQWRCEVWAWDGTDSGPSITSDPVTIANKPPTLPDDVQITTITPVYTDDPLTCSVLGDPSTDPDGDDVSYVFKWICTDCDDDPIIRNPKPVESNSDTLEDTYTDKGEQWSCEVSAQDETGLSGSPVTSASVTIENSPPEGLSAEITPGTGYLNDELTCTAIGVTDEDGDTISYKYEWEVMVDGNLVDTITGVFQENKETDTIVADTQGETWSCIVTARDDDGAEVGPVSSTNQVPIENRPPEITTVPTADPHIWDEGVTTPYTIEIVVSDPDGNEFTLEMDTNYVDPDDPNVGEWLDFDPNTNILSAVPPFGSSALDVDFGPGVLKFNFIVEETDGIPNNRVEKLVTAQIRFPALVVEDFEFPSTAPTLAENGWYKLQGSGSMLLQQEDSNDPNSNHYLKTTVTGTPTNNSQLNYIIYKNFPANTFNYEYPVMIFSIKDMNRFYLDAFVRGRNNEGEEDNFFLRHIPRDPNTMGPSMLTGKYVWINVGEEFIDPNGDITEIESNMEKYLYKETGYHYLYLKTIVVRGDISYLDNIMVGSTPPEGEPKDVVDLETVGNENQVTIQWTLPGNQVENIAGYNIYMDANNVIPTSLEALRIATVGPETTSHTETGLDNGVTYCFRVTAFNNLPDPDESLGVTDCEAPQVTTPLDPEDVEIVSIDGMIMLTWKSPTDQHPDLANYTVYYCDCAGVGCSGCYSEIVTADKADATGLFTLYIDRDESGQYLEYGKTYDFTVKAIDTADPPNPSDGVSASITLRRPETKSIDNFESEEPLMRRGWYKLMGSGKFTQKAGAGSNHYLEVKSNYTGTSALGYTIVKRLQNPTDFKNPNFAALVRSQGNFQIILFLRGKDNNNYFLVYKADPNSEEDSTEAVETAQNWYSYTLGWQNKASSTEWVTIERNLNDDLMNATPGDAEFEMLLSVILKGTLDIDDLALGEGVPGTENLTARAGDSSVDLSWTLSDPNKIHETKIYVNGSEENTITVSPAQQDYHYLVTDLTNNTPYEFKVVQFTEEGDESKGVSVSATPVSYRRDPFTFDNQTDLEEWPLAVSEGVDFNVVYDSGVQSYVMHLDPPGDYPDRYYAANESIDVSDVTGMTCRIKTSNNFVIWVNLEATDGAPFMLGFVPGSTVGNSSHFGIFGYYFLGQGLIDGNWHLLDLNLDEVINSIFTDTDIEAEKITGIYFGGRIYVDDVSIY